MSGNTSQTAQIEQWVQEAPSVPPVEMEGGDSGGWNASPKAGYVSSSTYFSPVSPRRY
jgi:hypothetical protein